MRIEKIGDLCQRLAKGPKPFIAMLEITTRCNLKCRFCYLADAYRREKDIPRINLFRIIDQLADMGCINIIIMGGEPFIRKDLLDIYHPDDFVYVLNWARSAATNANLFIFDPNGKLLVTVPYVQPAYGLAICTPKE